MNITLSIDERLVRSARRVAGSMGKSLNQIIREHLEEITSKPDAAQFGAELRRLSAEGRGNSNGWKFNREEAHERAKLP
jgi:hypothetical protein